MERAVRVQRSLADTPGALGLDMGGQWGSGRRCDHRGDIWRQAGHGRVGCRYVPEDPEAQTREESSQLTESLQAGQSPGSGPRCSCSSRSR